jgi:hypothetical protein
MARKKTSARDEPFQWASEQLHGSGETPAVVGSPKKATPIRKVKISPAGQVRQRSVGVSSSSRQRTNKRGPKNRKK